jgi:hypothetical protein
MLTKLNIDSMRYGGYTFFSDDTLKVTTPPVTRARTSVPPSSKLQSPSNRVAFSSLPDQRKILEKGNNGH